MKSSQVRSVTPLPERYSLVLRQSKYGPHPMVAFAHSAKRVSFDGLAVGTTAVGSTVLEDAIWKQVLDLVFDP
jgi:hypothetical protein